MCNFGHHAEPTAQTVDQIEAAGGSAVAIQASVAEREQVDRMASQVREKFEKVDIVVANAVAQIPSKPLLEQDLDCFKSQIDTCMWQFVHLVQAFVPLMPDGSRVIAINTECIFQNWSGQSAYVGAKMGLHG